MCLLKPEKMATAAKTERDNALIILRQFLKRLDGLTKESQIVSAMIRAGQFGLPCIP